MYSQYKNNMLKKRTSLQYIGVKVPRVYNKQRIVKDVGEMHLC
jgi:hypothetical protein